MIPSYYAQQRILPENAPVGPLFLCISAIYFGYDLLFPGERGITQVCHLKKARKVTKLRKIVKNDVESV